MKIEYGTETIEFDVVYRKRKTIEIGVEPPSLVRVVAPIGVSDEILLKHVKAKAKWIVQKLYGMKTIQSRHLEREYVNGESFMYLGRNYSLRIIEDKIIKKVITKLYQGKFIITTPTRDQLKLKTSMENWFRQKTTEKVEERVEYYQRYLDIKPTSIRVKEQKKRWASCTPKGELLFNWRCVMAPSFALDYIVVHEMCHLVHMDHSKEFWHLVGRIMPNYEKRREWLKNYGIKMDL